MNANPNSKRGRGGEEEYFRKLERERRRQVEEKERTRRAVVKKHLERAHAFFEKYGGRAVILARFVPIVRTFVPFVAGVGSMSYPRFIAYNVIGGFIWLYFFIYAGFWFGNRPFVPKKFKLVILAGGDFAPFEDDVRRLDLGDRIVLRQNVAEIEDYFQAADVGLFTSESESFCLSILEAMNFGCPSVATAVGGIPEVVENGKSGLLVPFGDADGLARALESLIANPARLRAMGQAAKQRARALFSAAKIVPRYEALYRRVCAERSGCEG